MGALRKFEVIYMTEVDLSVYSLQVLSIMGCGAETPLND